MADTYVNNAHIAEAIAFAREKHHFLLDFAMVRDVFFSIQTYRHEKHKPFLESLRQALDDYEFQNDSMPREACKTAMAKLFSLRRARRAKSVQKPAKRTRARKPSPIPSPPMRRQSVVPLQWPLSQRERLVFYSGARAAALARHDDELPDP